MSDQRPNQAEFFNAIRGSPVVPGWSATSAKGRFDPFAKRSSSDRYLRKRDPNPRSGNDRFGVDLTRSESPRRMTGSGN